MNMRNGYSFPKGTKEEYKKTLQNMVYKLLPLREEGKQWEKYLDRCILEIQGFHKLFEEVDDIETIRMLSKLEGLRELSSEEDFMEYRRTVLSCVNLIE